jgi:hypothetical protein
MRTQYTAPGVASALTAATPKTVLMVNAPATFGVNLLKLKVSFDGATSTAVPATFELVTSTLATAGTNTAVTVNQVGGTAITAGFTAGTNYTVEPTVLTVIDRVTIPVYGGTVIEPFTPGQEPNTGISTGIGIRITAAAAVNCVATAWFERA